MKVGHYPSETAVKGPSTEAPATLKVRTKTSAAEKQANYDRVCETQVRQFCFQQATQHALSYGSPTPKAPPMEDLLQSADLMFQWFKHGIVPAAKSASARSLN